MKMEWTESDMGYEDIRLNSNSIRELCNNYKLLNYKQIIELRRLIRLWLNCSRSARISKNI